MNNFITRTISGGVFAAIVIGCTVLGSWSLYALGAFIGFAGIYEFLKLQNDAKTIHIISAFALNTCFILLAANVAIADQYFSVALGAISVVIVFIYLLKFGQDVYGHLQHIFFSVLYVSVPVFLFLVVANNNGNYDFKKPLLIFFLVWSSDTFAYLTGRAFGKRPLAAEISPKKPGRDL